MEFDRAADGPGLRALMERKRVLNARQTAIRQRKFERLAKQQEEEQKRVMKEALECRRKERARLDSYLHPAPMKSLHQILKTTQHHCSTLPARPRPGKPCLVQNKDFAARLRDSLKTSAGNFLPDESRQFFFRTTTHIPPRYPIDLVLNNTRLLGSTEESEVSPRNPTRCGASKNLRVTFKEEEVERPLSPTVVLDVPDLDSSSTSNSSSAGQNIDKAEVKPREMHQNSSDDLNAFLEEALQLRLNTEAETNRMIAELTGLGSRLEDLHVKPPAEERSVSLDRFWEHREDAGGAGMQASTTKDFRGDNKLDFLLSDRIEDSGKELKVYRSEAWEVRQNELEHQDQALFPSVVGMSENTSGGLDSVGCSSMDEDASGKQPGGSSSYSAAFVACSSSKLQDEDSSEMQTHSAGGVNPSSPRPRLGDEDGFIKLRTSSCLPAAESSSAPPTFTHDHVAGFGKPRLLCSAGGIGTWENANRIFSDSQSHGRRSRKAHDLRALSREENNVLASIERLDYKLASAISKCRDSGLSDGLGSVQSAPTVIGGASRSHASFNSAMGQTSHPASRRRQNVGLTNKRYDKVVFPSISYSQSHTRGEIGYSEMADRAQEHHRCSSSPQKDGVIVFHPDAYCLLNPVG